MKSVDPTFQVDLDCIGELSECTKPNYNFNFYVDFKISIMSGDRDELNALKASRRGYKSSLGRIKNSTLL